VLMVDVYHEFEFPYEMMSAICRSLRPSGRVVFVEFRAEDPQVPHQTIAQNERSPGPQRNGAPALALGRNDRGPATTTYYCVRETAVAAWMEPARGTMGDAIHCAVHNRLI
jgi:hypothetical protein